MKLQQTILDKFSIILALAAIFFALPVIAAAQGKIVFQTNRDGNAEIYSMNPDGSGLTNLTAHPSSDFESEISADGSRIAFVSNRDGNYEIYLMNSDGSNIVRLTNHPGGDGYASISGDGSKIAFTSTRDNTWEIYAINADGSNLTRLTDNAATDAQTAVSPDGSKIAFASDRDGNSEIYIVNFDGSNPMRLTDNPAIDSAPKFSPDGSKIVFASERDGNSEVYVMNVDGTNQIRLTNDPSSDYDPAFSPDGGKITFNSTRDAGNAEIYTMNADGINQVNVTDSPAFDTTPSWGGIVADADADGVPGVIDNCPFTFNPDQADHDNDDIGDACDAQIGPPTDKNQCKNGGWAIFNFPRTFRNQGDCIRFVNTGHNRVVGQNVESDSTSRHTGGILVGMGDGSVRTVRRISLPNSGLEYDSVDAGDPNAASKTRALLDAADRLRRAVVITVPRGALGSTPRRVPTIELTVGDGTDANFLEVELEDVMITSFQVGGASGGGSPMQSVSLSFTKIKYRNTP